ncbi:hypothetical protein CAEBREN_09436 [Caenorhabditis brenneri]|uniref:T20D4.11-like domain-containing protein n=1 Tax=Caenorhabditis brenneri TaxID=135651 RepID=G0NB68_CAEBE|nr:hypothetical protein CAEBREN_09436 [Caenorhabditis brenneri]
MMLLAFLMLIPGVETKESPVKCEYADEKKVNECLQDCVSPVRCDSLSIDAVHASYSYMCGSGQPLFQKHAGCFAEVEAQKEYISCKIAATQAISEAQGAKSASTEAYLTEMCRAMDGYLRCSHPIILAKCGTDAWTLVSTVTRDSLGVTMPNCDMHAALF